MPKRQRVSRYSIVADAGANSNVSGQGSNSPRRRSSGGASLSSSASRSRSTPASTPSVSRTRNKNGGNNHHHHHHHHQQQQQQQKRAPSSSHQKPHQKPHHQPKIRPQQQQQQQQHHHHQHQHQQNQRQPAAEEILLQLLKACEKHHANYHPHYNPTNGSDHCDENDLPPSCKSAITNLRMLIPKLESTIAPFDDNKNDDATTSGGSTSKTQSKDIVHLCRFYDNVVRGNYCPHMPHLVRCGKDPKLILDKILYLLRNSLTMDLSIVNARNYNSNSNSNANASNNTTDSETAFLDVVSRTISGLMAFAIDDSGDHIRRKLFVDWIDFSEDLAVLATLAAQEQQQHPSQPSTTRTKNSDWFPVELALFEESSLVIEQRCRKTRGGREETREGGMNNDTNGEYFSLRLHRWDQVRVLHTIALNVLGALTSKTSALERLQTSPEQQHEVVEPAPSSFLLGGNVDLFFPSDVTTDLHLVSSLLASIKPALMVLPNNHDVTENNPISGNSPRVSATAIDILIRVCLDWHRLGTSTAVIPLLPCMIDVAVLTTKSIYQALSVCHRVPRDSLDDHSGNSIDEKRLAFLLDRAVCHPAGLDGGRETNADDESCISRTIHSAVWTTLFDCLGGIAHRLRLRLRRTKSIDECQDGPSAASNSDGEITTSTISSAASVLLLDIAVLETIHFIATTTPSLALTGSNYCTARANFPHLFFLASTTSFTARGNNDRSWHEDKTLRRAANQALAVLLGSQSLKDSNSAGLLEDVCSGTLKRHAWKTKQAILQQSENKRNLGLDNNTDTNSSKFGGSCDDEESGLQLDRRGSKRKRVSPTPDVLETSVVPNPNERDTKIPYPTIWYDALGLFFDLALDAGEGIKDLYARVASQNGTHCHYLIMGQIIEKICALSGGFHLSLFLLRKISKASWFGDQSALISGISGVVHELSKLILRTCSIVLGGFKTNSKLATQLWVPVADTVVGCGLSMHFSKLESKDIQDSHQEYVQSFLDCVSSFSGRLIELEPEQQPGLTYCSKCTGIPTYFTGRTSQDCCQPQCCMPSNIFSSGCNEQNNDWIFDKSITAMDSLPLFVRAALLTSLNPVQRNPFAATPNRIVEPFFGCYSLDLFTTIFDRYAKDDGSESSDFVSCTNVASLLHLLPLIIIPRCDDEGKSALLMGILGEKENGSQESEELSFNRALLRLLKKGVSPLLQSLKKKDSLQFQSLVSALGNIHTFITGGTSEILIRNPASVLQFIVTRHLRLCTIDSKKDEVSSILNSMLYDLAATGVKNDADPISRYLLWMCAARYCVSASPSEIRQRMTPKSSQKTSGNPDGHVSRKVSGRDPIIPWLIATPFSDPNGRLRKFISRELSSILMSKEYGFLLARFSSGEDFQEYCKWSRKETKVGGGNNIYNLLQVSDDIIRGLFEEIDVVLRQDCGFSETQLSLPFGRGEKREEEQSEDSESENRLAMQSTAAGTLASLCYHADVNHPIGKILFEKGILRLIRMWAATSVEKEDISFQVLSSTSTSRALAFGGLSRLSGPLDLSTCFSGDMSWSYFPSAIFSDVFFPNSSKGRREQYELLEALICSLLKAPQDSLQKLKSAIEASNIVNESIPLTISQLANEKDEETIQLIVGFNAFLTERYEYLISRTRPEIEVIGVPESPIAKKKSLAILMGTRQLEKKTKDFCLRKIDKILPLVLFYSDDLPLKFFMTLTAPVTLPDMMAGREQLILKGIAWELGRDHYREDSAAYALSTAAAAYGSDILGSKQRTTDASPGMTAAHAWVSNHFMYLIVNVVQLNWGSRKPAQQIHALRCLYILLNFLNPSRAAQYFPQVLATVNVAIAVDKVADLGQPEKASLRLHAVQCLSKFIRLAAKHGIEDVINNLTTIVVSLLPILEDDGVDQGGSTLQKAASEAVSMLEFLTRSEFVRKFSKAFSQIPFLPTSAALTNVHKSLRDNGINFDDLLILSTSTSESQVASVTRRESLTSDNNSNATSSSSGDNVLALQNRLSLVSSLLDNENASVRKVSLQHLVDLLRANRNLFHILVENDGGSSIKNYLTVIYERNENEARSEQSSHTRSLTSVTISNIIEKLMNRCVHETNPRVRLQLATCLGEIGAIGENRLDDMSRFRSKGSGLGSTYEWRLSQPPWQSRAAKYELQLVTRYLVTALRAAPSQEEQLKIAFTIQQLLLLLDESSRANGNEERTIEQPKSQKGDMSKWLTDRLVETNVYDAVKPFWRSEFSTKDERYSIRRQPPFFDTSKTYHLWISEFCRWMILKSKDCPLSRWKDFFFSCRIAVRSFAGLETAEFILPILVLDRICFGGAEEFESICQEFIRILDFESSSAIMSDSERRKAIGGFFAMIDTLAYWAEVETEQRYRSKRSSNSKRSSRDNFRQNSDGNSVSSWPTDETITQIQALISRIPLIDQARAAKKVGMYAKGLRLLEMVARKNIVEKFFESSSDDNDSDTPIGGNLFQQSLLGNADLGLMKVMLSNIDDCETMNVIGETSFLSNPLLKVADTVQWKEATGNYEGALRDYERALQVSKVSNSVAELGIERGALGCMLKLGCYESVLSRVLTEDRNSDKMATKSFAIEAACRLGQWDRLSSLVAESEADRSSPSPDDLYRRATGKTVLSLRNRDALSIADSIRTARTAVMENLSSVARESYSKAYPEIVRLQCIRELEDSVTLFCSDGVGGLFTLSETAESKLHEGWAWDGRLRLTTPRAASEIMNTRVAIARLSDDRIMEGSLLLDIGKQASSNGMATVAEKFYSQAEATLSLVPELQNAKHQKLHSLMDDVRVQYAKLKKESGENILALKILGQQMVQEALSEMSQNSKDIEFLKKVAVKHEQLRAEKAFGRGVPVGNERELIDRFANRLLRLTQWTVEGGMQSGNEVIFRFETVITLSPKWEKGHFQFAKHLNELVTRVFDKDSLNGIHDDAVRFNALFRDKACHQYILLAIEHFAQTLQLDMKHVYQTLPRLLSLWFDFVSVQAPKSDHDSTSGAMTEYLSFLTDNQNKANVLMAENTKVIPAAAYYTAMPQLISRVIHDNEDTAKVVKRILERVLVKFPQQAMWHLAWLKGSKNEERSKIGGDIFKGAQRVLVKTRQTRVVNLLKASDSLFKYLKDLAKYTPQTKSPQVSVKGWTGKAHLSEFVPPVQAALSISPFKSVNSPRDYFPRVIPRMRIFSPKITVMQSKARPKKLRAFVVPGTWKHANVNESEGSGGRTSAATPLDCDIGEIHFLVKQEAKGDLRKDARVQDLNNVINRLMASSNNSNSTLASRSRRLRVRTFAVTCLSEDTGILEWVPHTDSLRNLVHKSYNSQTASFCPRRRGSRMTNFGDATLRSQFDKAQSQFFKGGDIVQAARLYYLLCLKQHPPVLSWWFVQRFSSANDWYEARTKFTLTAAAWSAIGHVIGLGDRHSENILVETTTGSVVHVDFDCIFDKGLNLPRPEVVPFRLTPNMLDAFGPTGADGMFSNGMECSLEVLRENRDTLLSVLEPFIKDPVIDWKKHRTQQSLQPTARLPSDSYGEAKRLIHVIRERLSGICNLRNPNYKKYRNIIPRDHLSRVEQDSTTIDILPLSVEGQVQKLCAEASKNENLIQLYVGWMPWV